MTYNGRNIHSTSYFVIHSFVCDLTDHGFVDGDECYDGGTSFSLQTAGLLMATSATMEVPVFRLKWFLNDGGSLTQNRRKKKNRSFSFA